MNCKNIEEGLLELPTEMHKIEKELMDKSTQMRELQAEVDKMEVWMKYEISNETIQEADGKEKKKYSNAEQRQYAFTERTKTNTSYLELVMRVKEKEQDIEKLKIDFNYQKRMHRSYLAIASMKGVDEQ